MAHFGCGCCGWSRRRLLRGGFVAGAAAFGSGKVWAQGAAAPSLARPGDHGVRAIDIHAHYYPQTYFDVVSEEGKRFNAEYRTGAEGFFLQTPGGNLGPLPAKFTDLDQRLAEMDQQGVAMHALSLTTPMVYWADGDVSHKLARAWNDGAVAAHQAHPDRFVVLATLPMLDPDRAVDELDRVKGLPGVRGVYMGTNINGHDLDDPLFAPIFARIEAHGLPVFLHPLQTIGGKRMSSFYLSNLLGNPFDTAIAACHLIFGGVMDRHPRLQVNLPHAGGSLPTLIGRIDHGWKVRKETKALAAAPSTYLRRFTYDTISHSRPVMEFVIAQVGIDRIVLGSDYCFDMGYERPLDLVEALDLSSEQRAMVLGGNAAKLLGI